MQTAVVTDAGVKRKSNQDAVLSYAVPCGPLRDLFIVADGMGGHLAGDVASRETVRYIEEAITGNTETLPDENILPYFEQLVQEANEHIYQMAEANPDYNGMGTTIVMITVKNGVLYATHVGDSRLYMWSPEYGLERLTEDHNVPQQLVNEGLLARSQIALHPQRHVLTRVIGLPQPIEADSFHLELTQGCRLLLCSDGLTTMLNDDEIEFLLTRHPAADEAVNSLLDETLLRGAEDNVSIIMINLEGEDFHAE